MWGRGEKWPTEERKWVATTESLILQSEVPSHSQTQVPSRPLHIHESVSAWICQLQDRVPLVRGPPWGTNSRRSSQGRVLCEVGVALGMVIPQDYALWLARLLLHCLPEFPSSCLRTSCTEFHSY